MTTPPFADAGLDTSPDAPVARIDRRTALAWVSAVSAAGGLSRGALAGTPLPPATPPRSGAVRGYGLDPRLNPPDKAPWPRILGPLELKAAAILADFILPETKDAPAANRVGVADFIDEWVSAPYPDQALDRGLIAPGLTALAPEILSDGRRRTFALEALRRDPDPVRKAFFTRFRALTVGAYYATDAGFKDIGYIGNVARAFDPGPSDAAKAAVDAQLERLGL